jgi:NADP-dependent 3-hydroxy acid dehydrogenase YdfG
MGSLDGRRVVVTGASSGIGAALARAAAAEGERVGLLARRADRLSDLADEIGGASAAGDVTDPGAVTTAVDRLAAELGGLDALVSAAGTMHLGAVADTDPEVWREILAVNVVGHLAAARAALAHLGEGSSIVSLSSMSGRRVPSAAGGVYAASKHAVHAVDETLRLEAGPRGVRVTTVAPGFVATDLMAADHDRDDVASFRARMHDEGLRPADVAAAVVHVLGLPPSVCVVEYALTSMRQQGLR